MKLKDNSKFAKGMTLVEMLIAIFIFTMSIAGFSMLFVQSWKSNSYTLEMGESSMAASQGVNKMVNYIRGARQSDNGAYPIKSADENDLVIYADYDKDDVTERLHFYKNGQDILMGATNPTAGMPKTYPSGDELILTLASHIVNDSNAPIFYYYDQNYPGDAINNPMSVPAVAFNVRLIKIYLKINIVSNRAPDNIEMQSFVEIRNLNDYDRIK
ncbi:MAG: prepilin-type N-terminal cleavage/methylation domain-containing protein [bacterium]|nr:prepilin-type N-terminal cleavage/methylation domain-containing protein [bacterium]